MFTVVVGMREGEKEQRFRTFNEAFTAFYNGIHELLERGTTYQELETACWIAYEGYIDGQACRAAFGWYDVRDFAHEAGLITAQGELIANAPAVPDRDAVAAMIQATLNGFLADFVVDLERLQILAHELRTEVMTLASQNGSGPSRN